MPFKSRSQQRWMFAAEARKEVPAGTAKHWAAETKKQKGGFQALPERVAAGEEQVSEKASPADGTATGARREPDGTKTGAARYPHGIHTVATRRQLHLPDGSVLDLVNPGQYKSAMNMPNPNADMLQQLRAYMRVGQGPVAGASLQPADPTGAVPGLPGGMAKNVIAQQGGLAGASVVGAGAPGVGAKMAEAKYRIEDTRLFGRLKTAAKGPLGWLKSPSKATQSAFSNSPFHGGAGHAVPTRADAVKTFFKQPVSARTPNLTRGQAATIAAPVVAAPVMGYAANRLAAYETPPAVKPPGTAAARPTPVAKPQSTPNPVGVPPAPEPPAGASIASPDTDNYGEFVNQITKPPATSPTAKAGPAGYVKPSLAQSQIVGTPPVTTPATSQTGPGKAESAATPKPNASPDWMAQIQEFLKNPKHQGAMLGMGAAGLGDYLLSSKDDREERSGFSSILPWLLGGGAGYYFGPELMKMLGGDAKAKGVTPEDVARAMSQPGPSQGSAKAPITTPAV